MRRYPEKWIPVSDDATNQGLSLGGCVGTPSTELKNDIPQFHIDDLRDELGTSNCGRRKIESRFSKFGCLTDNRQRFRSDLPIASTACSTLRPMADRPKPVFRTRDEVLLVGTMAIYGSQDEASERIPQQWREFRRRYPALGSSSDYYGASPCTSPQCENSGICINVLTAQSRVSSPDRKLHYLTGVAQQCSESAIDGERLRLEAGEYAVVRLNDAALLRDNWIWLLRHWLPNSGFREKNAPEFERFTGISEAGTPIGPVEIWIPLKPAGIEDL